MKISFAETGPSEREFFEKELTGHEIEFCDTAGDCASDTEVLSIFINSKIEKRFLEAHPALRLIVTRSTTHDHIQLSACARSGVTICGVGSYGDHTVPEGKRRGSHLNLKHAHNGMSGRRHRLSMRMG